MAGLRTNALVALGAALFELLAVQMTAARGVDPTRIAAYVVSGIGFLGAGVILRDGVNVRGINTAATIWCSAAVGALAVQALTRDDFVLRTVRSEDLDLGSGLVQVTADLQRYGRDDVALEAAVSRLSLEPSVSSVTWNVVETTVPLAAAADE